MKTNLVIATWSGRRRVNEDLMKEHYADGALFLKKQITYLKKIKHNLSQITFVIPENLKEPKEFRDYLARIPSQINQTKIVILEKDNIGMSYGSFSYVFEIYKEEFDYYIFLEDDYLFVEDNFDKTLIEMFNKNEKCGYLSGTVYQSTKYPDHPAKYPDYPANFNGITKSKILLELWEKYKKLPYALDASYSHAEMQGQVAYGTQIIALGYKLYGLNSQYEIPHLMKDGRINSQYEIPHLMKDGRINILSKILKFDLMQYELYVEKIKKKDSRLILVPSQMINRKSLCKRINLL